MQIYISAYDADKAWVKALTKKNLIDFAELKKMKFWNIKDY